MPAANRNKNSSQNDLCMIFDFLNEKNMGLAIYFQLVFGIVCLSKYRAVSSEK